MSQPPSETSSGYNVPPGGMPAGPPPGPVPTGYQPSGPSGPRASFGRRFVASLVDGLVIGVFYVVLLVIVGRTAGYAFSLLLSLGYLTFFEGGSSGQTIGKRMLGIRVIDFNSGGPIGYGRALLRWVGRLLSEIPCLLGYFWMLWDKEKQTWHDKLANSVVVPVQYYPVSSWP